MAAAYGSENPHGLLFDEKVAGNCGPQGLTGHKGWLAVFLVAVMATAAVAGERNDLEPLKSAAPQGVGPVSLAWLHHGLQGAAFVYGSAKADLFVTSDKKAGSELYLFKWLRDDPKGTPIFAPPVRVAVPFLQFLHRGTIFQTSDKKIHGLWNYQNRLVHGIFDLPSLSFKEAGTLTLPKLPDGSARLISTSPNADGSVDMVFEQVGESTPGTTEESNASTEAWRPYNSAGISTAPQRYTYLYGGHLPGLLTGPFTNLRRLTPTRREIHNEAEKITPVNFGPSHPRGWVAGTRTGNFIYYPQVSDPAAAKRWLASDLSGNALRHPSHGGSVAAYPNSDGTSNLIAAGQGDLYFYRFTGRFTSSGAPQFEDPTPVLQENAFLTAGTLASMTVIDWDGDNVRDIMVGNSEGFVLFFKNIGSDSDPRFLPGQRVQAAGKDIQVQAGYSGSLQGIGESRWGYVSPTVVDWTGDGLPDIVMGDITGSYTVYINRGTRKAPALDAAHPIYCYGLNLHGMWRVRPAVAKLDGRMAMIIVDGDDNFHLYWKIDDYNVEDGGKLTLADGSLISASRDPGGGTGRCKLDLYDYDGDGKLDLIIGTVARSSIPNKEAGYPWPSLGNRRALATPLFMRNVGSNAKPVFETPMPFAHVKHGLVQPGGAHETGAIATTLGGGKGQNLLVASQGGRLFLLQAENLRLLKPSELTTVFNQKKPISDE